MRPLLADGWTDGCPGEWATPGVAPSLPTTLPAIEDGAELLSKPIVLPADVIKGVLHRGAKMVLAGGSKSYKTWALIETGVSVATGATCLNNFETEKGHVLYLNFELPDAFFWNRVRTICDERQLTIEPHMLSVWNLRGHVAHWTKLDPQIAADTYSLIIIDPTYKLLFKRAENLAGDVASLMNEFEALAVRTGAAVAFGAHYSKGDQSQKEAMDRISGSGVFARDPDSIINFARHEEADCYSVDLILRNHPPQASFVMRWDFPLFITDLTLDPTRLKKRKPSGAAEKQYTVAQFIGTLDDEPMFATQIVRRAARKLECAERTAWSLLDEAKELGALKPQGRQWQRNPNI